MKKSILVCAILLLSASGHAECPTADLSGDCYVDFEDLAVMANLWLTGNRNIPDDMVYIPDGGFEMGDHFAEGESNELPLHAVLLDAFFMSRFEITNRQYCDYLNSVFGTGIYISGGTVYGTGSNLRYCFTSTSSSYSQIDYSVGVFSAGTKGGRDMSDDPMVPVSWHGAGAYCNWRSSEEGYEACYDLSTWECDFSKHGYRLPTEAEWEYAARGGEHNPYYRFPWGDTISHSQANYYSHWVEGVPYYPYDVSPTEGDHPLWDDGIRPYTSVVGSFFANGYGLYDMAGNVWEWCNDWYDSDYYDTSPYDNPTGPASGVLRVLRGGGWGSDPVNCPVAGNRVGRLPVPKGFLSGFRIVLDLE